jgi:hypothetical protein
VKVKADAQKILLSQGEVVGHGEFDDGRKRAVRREFVQPESEALYWVNVMMGNGGYVRFLSCDVMV